MESELQTVLEAQLNLMNTDTLAFVKELFPIALGVLVSLALVNLGLQFFLWLSGLGKHSKASTLPVGVQQLAAPYKAPTMAGLGSTITPQANWTMNDYQQANYIANGTPLHGQFETALNSRNFEKAHTILNIMRTEPAYKDYIKADENLLSLLQK